MRVTTFLRTAGEGAYGPRKREVLVRFHEGLLAQGADAVACDGYRYEPTDILVMFGGRPSPGHAPTQEILADIAQRHAGDRLLLETPILGRRVTRRPAIESWLRRKLKRRRALFDDPYDHYRVGINGFMRDDADFNNGGCPPDRWRALSGNLDLEIEPYRRDGRAVLILGQVPGDTSLRGADIIAWMVDTARQARSLTDRPVIVRPHPATSRRDMQAIRESLAGLSGVRLSRGLTKPIREAVKGVWAVVAYSSGAAVDVVMAGVPCITLHPANMAWPVSDHALGAIESPTLFDRRQWLHDLAYAQWSIEEIGQGEPWRHLRPALLRQAA